MIRIASTALTIISLLVSAAAAQANFPILPDIPDGAQAISLLGEELKAGTPTEELLENLAAAKAEYQSDPGNVSNIIWLGRRLGYVQNYRDAIEVFSEGIEIHLEDARFYRHRGHRYISVREFDRAITDFKIATTLIEGTEDEIEPDGAPNPAGIPVSTLHSNIRYHLGLAYYLSGDLINALRVYEIAIAQSPNDDDRVATTHWLYMTLRLLGREKDAAAVLEPIHEDMNVIESMTWHYYNGRTDAAKAGFDEIIATGGWASFGRIAAESDLARKF